MATCFTFGLVVKNLRGIAYLHNYTVWCIVCKCGICYNNSSVWRLASSWKWCKIWTSVWNTNRKSFV